MKLVRIQERLESSEEGTIVLSDRVKGIKPGEIIMIRWEGENKSLKGRSTRYPYKVLSKTKKGKNYEMRLEIQRT